MVEGLERSLSTSVSRFDSRTLRPILWAEIVGPGSLLCCERFFSGTPVFHSTQKPTLLSVVNNFDLIVVDLI